MFLKKYEPLESEKTQPHCCHCWLSSRHATMVFCVLCFFFKSSHHDCKYEGRSAEPVEMAWTKTHPMFTLAEKSRGHWTWHWLQWMRPRTWTRLTFPSPVRNLWLPWGFFIWVFFQDSRPSSAAKSPTIRHDGHLYMMMMMSFSIDRVWVRYYAKRTVASSISHLLSRRATARPPLLLFFSWSCRLTQLCDAMVIHPVSSPDQYQKSDRRWQR